MIEIKITGDNADAVAAQLREFVDMFVNMARSTMPPPFVNGAGAQSPEAEPAKRTRKKAEVVDATATEVKTEEAAPAAPKEVTPDDVRAILNRLRSEKGTEALGKVVTQFAPKFSEISPTSFPAVYAAAEKALAA